MDCFNSAFLIYSTLFVSPLPQAHGNAQELSFRENYGTAVPTLEKSISNVRCKTKLSMTRPNAHYLGEADIFVKDDRGLVLIDYDQDSSSDLFADDNVACRTPEYAFDLRRSHGSKHWIIKSFDKDPGAIKRAAFSTAIVLDIHVFASVQAFDVRLKDLLKSNDCKITDITMLAKGGDERVEVTFNLHDSDTRYQEVRVVLVPSLGWSIEQYEAIMRPWTGTRLARVRGSVQYQRWKPGDFVFPKSVSHIEEVFEVGKEEPFTVERKAEFLAVDRGSVEDSQFTLAKFGLPDIGSGRRSYYPFDNWFFWMVVVLALTSTALLWYKYRRAA
jgi:hypothetical protein